MFPPPPPFNKFYRPGFGEAVSRMYQRYCEMNPHISRQDRKQAHREISQGLIKRYPTWMEKAG